MTNIAITDVARASEEPQWTGGPWPKGYRANPTGMRVSKRVTQLFADMEREFGGGGMAPSDRAQLMLACRSIVKAERERDPDVAVRWSGDARRNLQDLRRRAKPAPQATWQERMAARVATEPLPDAPDDTPPTVDATP